MIYHVLPGDSLVEEFRRSGIAGEVIVCREALVDGPIDAENLDEFWDQRARFILSEFGDDQIEYHEKVANELDALRELTGHDEINLWFEYELFCSVNMWFCLSLLAGTDASVFRVEPIGLNELSRWDGFGQFGPDDLRASFELRTPVSETQQTHGVRLWNAYRKGDHASLDELGRADHNCYPYLREVVAAAIEQEIEPLETVRAITRTGERDFGKIFGEFKKRAGVYGYGDTQVRRLLDRVAAPTT